MWFSARLGAALVVGLALVGRPVSGLSAEEMPSVTLTPSQARTVAQSRCAPPDLSTEGTTCTGFAGREILETPDIFVVGYQNDQENGEKFVYQAVAAFDLSPARPPSNAELTHATLGYGEDSTVRRAAGGGSEFGILPTCNTGLGVPTTPWDGSTDKILATRPAGTAGMMPATTGDYGSWDVTPQIKEWLAAGQQQGTLVMRGDDESMDFKQDALCLSYLGDFSLTVEYAVRP